MLPLDRILEAELEVEVRLAFDSYSLDLASGTQAFQKLVAGGVPVNEALATSGLLADCLGGHATRLPQGKDPTA